MPRLEFGCDFCALSCRDFSGLWNSPFTFQSIPKLMQGFRLLTFAACPKSQGRGPGRRPASSVPKRPASSVQRPASQASSVQRPASSVQRRRRPAVTRQMVRRHVLLGTRCGPRGARAAAAAPGGEASSCERTRKKKEAVIQLRYTPATFARGMKFI